MPHLSKVLNKKKKNQPTLPSAHCETATLFSKVTYTPVRKHWSKKRGGMPRCGLGGLNKTITACVTAPNRDRLPLSLIATTQFIGISKPTALRKPTQVGPRRVRLDAPEEKMITNNLVSNRFGRAKLPLSRLCNTVAAQQELRPTDDCFSNGASRRTLQRVPITRSTVGLSARGVNKFKRFLAYI